MTSYLDRCYTLAERICADAVLARALPPGIAETLEELGAALLDGGVLDAAAAAMDEDYQSPPIDVDTREQDPFRPYLWQKGRRVGLEPELVTLAEGDYTTPAARDYLRIERKSIPDLYGTLFGVGVDALGDAAPNLERFRRELARLSRYHRAFLVIEGTRPDLAAYIQHNRRQVTPQNAIQLVEALALDYGITVEWSGSRESAERFVGYLLARVHGQATSYAEARKAFRRGVFQPWIPSAFVTRFVEAHPALATPCPRCSAYVGYVCLDDDGSALPDGHEERMGS